MDTGRHAAIEYDTYVVDDPDGWKRPRNDDDEDEDEIEMRIMLDGFWHRELDPDLTVCEKPFPLTGQYRTASNYDGTRCPGKLCPGCYFPSEIARAEASDQVVEEDRLAAIEDFNARDWRDRVKPFSLGDEIDRQRRRTDRIAAVTKKPTNGR